MSNTNSFIACQSGGYYGDSCLSKGWINSGQSFVIDWRMFQKFMNAGVATRPVFISDSYKLCIEMAKELNNSATEIQMKEMVEEYIKEKR
jgi:hypothetical protein